MTHSLSSAETPSRRREAWAARPGTVSRKVIAPAWATTTSRPDGSVMTARSPVAPARIAASVPCPPSSSDGTSTTSSSPPSRWRSPATSSARTAATIAATPPFMSQAPRPNSSPSRTSPAHGSTVQVAGSPAGTTSRWPDRISRRPPGRPARPMTTGSDVRGISWPGQAGSSRIATRVGGELLDGQADAAQRRRRPDGHGLLRSGDARDPDQLAQVRNQPISIDRPRPNHPG